MTHYAIPANISTPSDTKQAPYAVEASEVDFSSSRELAKPTEQDYDVPESNARVLVSSKAVIPGSRPRAIAVNEALPSESVKQSKGDSERQPLAADLGRSEGTHYPTPSSKTDFRDENTAPKFVRHAMGRKMESKSAKSTQSCSANPSIATGSGNHGKEPRSSPDGDLEVQIVTVSEACPPAPDSSGERHAEPRMPLLRSTQSDSELPRSIVTATTGSKYSDVGVVQRSHSTGSGFSSPEKYAEPQQHDSLASPTRTINNSARFGLFESDINGDSDASDVHARALGEQVRSAWAIRANRAKLTKSMRELESRRREACLELRKSLALMDSDIREHLGLSSALERLQNVVKEKEREVAAVVRRIDIGRSTTNRIRKEQQTCEDSIKKMEGEFSSSGKQLQGILQALGIL